jgi:hypothetical protein
MKKLGILFVLFIGITLYSCEYKVIEPIEIVLPPPPAGGYSFATDIEPILTKDDCTGCHSSSNALDFTASDIYEQVTTETTVGSFGSAGLSYINETTPDQSPLILIPTGEDSHPSLLSPTEVALMVAWITDGAKE